MLFDRLPGAENARTRPGLQNYRGRVSWDQAMDSRGVWDSGICLKHGVMPPLRCNPVTRMLIAMSGPFVSGHCWGHGHVL